MQITEPVHCYNPRTPESTLPILAGVVGLQTSTESGQTARAPWYRYGVLLPGYVVLAISISMIAGWMFQPEIFQGIVAGFGEIQPNSALGFFFLASALLLLDNPRWPARAVSRGCALCATLIGTLTISEYLIGLNLGIDQWSFPGTLGAGSVYAGRMSPVTALNLMLLGAAILLLDLRRGRFSLSTFFTWSAAGLAFLALTGSAYDAVSPHQLRMFSRVSVCVSITFLLLCGAIILARPERGVPAILFRRDLGGEAVRRLLPAAIIVPVVVGLLISKMHQAGTYGSTATMFLLVVAPVVTFVPLVLFSASLLSRMENERKHSEDELRVSTERFSSVVGSAMDAIITLDENLKIIVFNEAAEKMFGCASWDAMGKPLDRFLPAQYRELHPQNIHNFRETGVTTRSMVSPSILSAVRANGEQFPIEATISYVMAAGQNLYTVILRDITERKRAEETLRQSEARFRSLYEQAAVGIAQVAHDGQVLMVNAALCGMLGYNESELRGRKISEFIHPEDQEREAELLNEMQRGHRRSYEIEKRYLNRDGAAVWVHVSSALVHDSGGSPLYRISVVQNLTERKRAEEQLKQAQKMEAIGRLAGGVAHDFNTLLNVMLGYSDLLLAELPAGDVRRDRVMQIKNSGAAAAMLTKQLLAFSRKQVIAQEVMDLREAASKMTPIVGRLLREDIELTVRCSEDSCPVKVDPGQMQQLVLNLVANAGDAMPNGGKLNIAVSAVDLDEDYVKQHPTLKVGRYAMLAISDSGMGMDAETVAHIFEPFFTTKAEGKGTGLGLATVYGIVKRNNGDIWVYSEPGVGTTFKIFLPLTAEPLPKKRLTTDEFQGIGGSGETILLVEDSASLRELTKVILKREGYNILEAEDGVAALEVSEGFQGEIHLLLTDVVMPRMRGPQLAEQIVKRRSGIAVVFLSGYTEDAISQSGGRKGFTLVEKPFTADTLLRSVRRVLDHSSSESVPSVEIRTSLI